MKTIPHLPKKGDPRLNVWIPKSLKEQLDYAAGLSKQRVQNEIISRLVATFKYETTFNILERILR